MAGTKKKTKATTTVEEKNSRRAFWGTIIAAIMALIGVTSAAFINGWFTTKKSIPETGIYRVRVNVEDEKGAPINDAEVKSSWGGESKRIDGGLEFDIPAETIQKGSQLTVTATQKKAFLRGEKSFTLEKEMFIAIPVVMKHDDSAQVGGIVIDSKGLPVADVQVWITGHPNEFVMTDERGNFKLAAHCADNEDVEVNAKKGKLHGFVSQCKAGYFANKIPVE